MNNFIQPYQYVSIKEHSEKLFNVYKSVNDPKTIDTFQAITNDHIEQLFTEKYSEVDNFINIIMNPKSIVHKLKSIAWLKVYVIPFQQPSSKQIEKVFKKTKNLNNQIGITLI